MIKREKLNFWDKINYIFSNPKYLFDQVKGESIGPAFLMFVIVAAAMQLIKFGMQTTLGNLFLRPLLGGLGSMGRALFLMPFLNFSSSRDVFYFNYISYAKHNHQFCFFWVSSDNNTYLQRGGWFYWNL